jgi:transposase-like protein
MNLQFKSLPQLFKQFPDDASARAFLEAKMWNGTPVCPYCSSDRWYKLKDGKQYKCGNPECCQKYTVTVGTFLHGSHLPLNLWFAAMYLMSSHKKGISSHQLARDLNITQKSAWFVLHRIRGMVKEKEKIQFKDATIEIDETMAGGKMRFKHKHVRDKAHLNNLSHNANKVTVMGILERGGQVKTLIVDAKQKTFKDEVKDQVDASANIITDGHPAYVGLDKHFASHLTVDHKADEYVRGSIHTNTIEGFFSQLKRSIYGIYHWVSPKHLQAYCNETCYRYNHRKLPDNERFVLSLTKIKGRLTYSQLIQREPTQKAS